MKNLLIIYNVIFLFAGNMLFSNIHYTLHHHHHHSNEYEADECQDCIIIENSSNLITNFQEVSFSNNNINLFVSIYFNIIEFNAKKIYLSRSPPIS